MRFGCHCAATKVKGTKTASPTATTRTTPRIRQRLQRIARQDNADMWSNLLLPLLLLHFVHLHATLAMATASGGLTVIEGASTTSSTTTTTTTGSSSSRSSHSTTTTTTSSSSNDNNNNNNSGSNNSGSNNSRSTTHTTHTTATGSVNIHMALATAPVVPASSQRKRHRKRNSSWYDYRNYNENTTAPEWINPCGGSYHTPSATERNRAQRPKQIFNQLKRAAGTEYHELNSTEDHSGIDIRDMHMWSLHKYNYKFLPKLKPNSTIALKRWYRNMQTYVASFAYLRRVQINWDRQYLKRESNVAKELKKLLLSSRSMLCELETAVNRTYPPLAPGRAGAAAAKQRRQKHVSRHDMNKRLKLRSKTRTGAWALAAVAAAAAAETTTETAAAAAAAAAIGEADAMDMRFVKHHYYEFLRTMWQLMRRHSKREREQQKPLEQRQRQRPHHHHHHHHQHHQQQHQQQQQQQQQKRQQQQQLQ
ncbi:PREDICTED: putative mediator of RNA polymerase II transcription subunit 26, partial [Drosophila arizonae]|uniref:Mediator of RNA polymerase II transcription subunit 26 n=1 Tax=Drosophila arizonae TaxID=7263 RepID=A0ABM1PRS6_DROAR